MLMVFILMVFMLMVSCSWFSCSWFHTHGFHTHGFKTLLLSGDSQLPDNMWVSRGPRVFVGCLHIIVLWLAVQGLIIAEGVQRQTDVNMQIDALTSLATLGAPCAVRCAVRCGHMKKFVHTNCSCSSDFDDINEYNTFLLAYLDKNVGYADVWNAILSNNTMVKPWVQPYYLGDALDQVVQQQLYGPRNTTCVAFFLLFCFVAFLLCCISSVLGYGASASQRWSWC